MNTTEIVTQASLLSPPSEETAPPAQMIIPSTISPALTSLPKEVIITNEKSLTKEGYSKMKSTAEQDIHIMIMAVTNKSKEEIGNAINNAKSTVLIDINNEYDSILKDLAKYDTTKEDLEKETTMAIEAMHTAKLQGVQIQASMTSVREQHAKIEQDILISRASITQTHDRKTELNELITATTTHVINLKKDTDSLATAITAATITAKDKAIDEATSYLSIHNDILLNKMERVFACNMQLMEDEKEDFDVNAAVQSAIEKCVNNEKT